MDAPYGRRKESRPADIYQICLPEEGGRSFPFVGAFRILYYKYVKYLEVACVYSFIISFVNNIPNKLVMKIVNAKSSMANRNFKTMSQCSCVMMMKVLVRRLDFL